MRRGHWATAVVMAASLALVASALALAAPSHYFPKPHQACKAGYVRKTVKVRKQGKTVKRAECVEKPRIATTIHVLSSLDYSGGAGYDWSDSVSAEVAYNRDNNTLDGVPLRFAVVNDVTGKTVATFSHVANIFDSCGIVASLDSSGKTETLTGQEVGTDPGCPLSPITVPAHSASLLVTFAGNGRYAPSSGTGSLG